MKKLLTIAVLAGMVSGLYGLSFGLGGRYEIGHYSYLYYGEDSSFSYPSIKADVMVKPMPILGLRFGLFTYNILPTEEKEALASPVNFVLGTGIDAAVLIYIPMAGTISPYIPFHFAYQGTEYYSAFTVDGGVGVEAGLGPVSGYLEGGINFYSVSPDMGDSFSPNWFYVQGGIRIPVKM